MHLSSSYWTALLLTYFLLVASTCEETADPGPLPEDLTKERRERLGEILHDAILQSPRDFPILDRASKGDSVIQEYLQALYNQATQRIRLDRSSPETNRWQQDRDWLVTVIDDPNRFAFSLPSGYFYISTGFLESIQKGYEIYYLLAFEATNVNQQYLLENLSNQYGISTLVDIAENPTSFSPLAIEEILEFLQKDIEYEPTIIQEIDEATAELICSSSIFDRFGVVPLLSILNEREQWRDTRPSYTDRLQFLTSLPIDNCGAIKSTGAYQKMVLDNL